MLVFLFCSIATLLTSRVTKSCGNLQICFAVNCKSIKIPINPSNIKVKISDCRESYLTDAIWNAKYEIIHLKNKNHDVL